MWQHAVLAGKYQHFRGTCYPHAPEETLVCVCYCNSITLVYLLLWWHHTGMSVTVMASHWYVCYCDGITSVCVCYCDGITWYMSAAVMASHWYVLLWWHHIGMSVTLMASHWYVCYCDGITLVCLLLWWHHIRMCLLLWWHHLVCVCCCDDITLVCVPVMASHWYVLLWWHHIGMCLLLWWHHIGMWYCDGITLVCLLLWWHHIDMYLLLWWHHIGMCLLLWWHRIGMCLLLTQHHTSHDSTFWLQFCRYFKIFMLNNSIEYSLGIHN
jgi:hypothetical protein